ncbi:hypothetical protein, partial [Buchananella hordeovulneris]|uniref:hypothetical protein n=1 Tax=Buchananella hordeovulneris TaxID=52770 RepID=UPI001C9E58B3
LVALAAREGAELAGAGGCSGAALTVGCGCAVGVALADGDALAVGDGWAVREGITMAGCTSAAAGGLANANKPLKISPAETAIPMISRTSRLRSLVAMISYLH